MKRRPKFTEVSLDDETTLSLADHEILLKFVSDSDAEAFHYYWEQEGNHSFAEWLITQDDQK